MMDAQEDLYERVVYSLLDMSGNIGGLYGVFLAGGGVIIGYFAQRLLEFSMLSRLYQTIENDNSNKQANSKEIKINDSNKIGPKVKVLMEEEKNEDNISQKESEQKLNLMTIFKLKHDYDNSNNQVESLMKEKAMINPDIEDKRSESSAWRQIKDILK